MPIAVYTTMLGETDPVRCPTVFNPKVRYVCFTDRPARIPRPYLPVPIALHGEPSTLASRRLKILASHPALGSARVTIWHDAAFQLMSDPLALVKEHLADRDMLAFRHPHRSQIEDEAAVIARLGYAPADVLQAQIATYRAEGFPVRDVITSTGFCIRRMTDPVIEFGARWWGEVERWSWRDQMSVDYALWRSPTVKVAYIPGHYRDNTFAKWHPDSTWKRRPRRLARRPSLLPLKGFVQCRRSR